MRINELKAVSFGCLRIEQALRLEEGLCLWVAPNQTGKTTLLTFLEWMLYGPPGRRVARDPALIRRFTPWGGGPPGGSIVVQPGLRGWPGELLITARFADYSVVLTEYRTQKTLPERVVVSRAGEWNLGEQLLGLGRESYRSSLSATQETILDPLQPGALRRILTSDLGSLVENPQLATVDRMLAQIDNPLFILDGSTEPRPLKLLKHDVVKELDLLQLERTKLEQQLVEFKELIEQRDALSAQLEQQDRVLASLGRQARQLELARSYYLVRVGRPAAPPVGDLPPGLTPEQLRAALVQEHDVDRLAGQFEAIERELRTEEGGLARLEERFRAEEGRLRGAPEGASRIDSARQLRDAAAEVDGAYRDFRRAIDLCSDLESRVPVKERERYSELDKLFSAHHDHLTTIMAWQREELEIDARLAGLRERRAELQVLMRTPLPWTFYFGLLLALGAAPLMLAYSPAMYEFAWFGYCMTALILATAALLISPVWRRRRLTGPAGVEFNQKVLPAIEAEQGNLGVQDRKRRRFIDLYGIDRLAWDRLVENIIEYGQLDIQMRELQAAQRDRDTVNRRLNAAWLEIASFLPLAPLSVDMKWLGAQLRELSGAATELSSLSELATQVEAQRADVARLRGERERCFVELSSVLEPLGLKEQLAVGVADALAAFRRLADSARRRREAEERLSVLDESGLGMVLDAQNFEREWEALEEAERYRLSGLASTRQGFEIVCARLKEVVQARADAEAQRERLRKSYDLLRDELTKFGRIDREAADLTVRVAGAERRQVDVDRWDIALKMAGSILDSLVSRASQEAAPEVDRALRQALAAAPIPGVREARISGNLELHLSVDGAPANIPAAELWTHLSAGVQQQLALALRLAMARTASGRTDLPLILDEPLAGLDDEQARLVFRYIAELAGSTQVLLVTCHERLYTWLSEGLPGVRRLSITLARPVPQ